MPPSAWSATHDPSRSLDIAIGFGWAWVVLGDSRGAQRLLTALHASGDQAKPQERAAALLLAAWIEASTGDLSLARTHIADAAAVAEALDDDDLQARCCYYLAYVVSHDGDFRQALRLTEHESKSSTTAWTDPGTKPPTPCSPAEQRSPRATEARAVEEMDRVQHWLSEVDDPWLRVRGDAMLGELARLQRRFDDAVQHLARAAETSGRLGYPQTEAYQVASLGRAQAQAGDDAAAAATLQLAVTKAEAIGDVRMAALARVHLGRVRRALGDMAGARTALDSAAEWHRRAGGGEQARLGECLLAAIDAAAGDPGAEARLGEVLERRESARRAARRGVRARRPRRHGGPRRPARPSQGAARRGRWPHGVRRPLHHRTRPDRRRRGSARASRPDLQLALRLTLGVGLLHVELRPGRRRHPRWRTVGVPGPMSPGTPTAASFSAGRRTPSDRCGPGSSRP